MTHHQITRFFAILLIMVLAIMWIPVAAGEESTTTTLTDLATDSDLDAGATVTVMKELSFSLNTYDSDKTIENLNRIAKEAGCLGTWQSTGIAEINDKAAQTILLNIPSENAESFLKAVSSSETISSVHKEYAEVSIEEATATTVPISLPDEYRATQFLISHSSPGITRVTILYHVKRTAEESRALQQEKKDAENKENASKWIIIGVSLVVSMIAAAIRSKRR